MLAVAIMAALTLNGIASTPGHQSHGPCDEALEWGSAVPCQEVLGDSLEAYLARHEGAEAEKDLAACRWAECKRQQLFATLIDEPARLEVMQGLDSMLTTALLCAHRMSYIRFYSSGHLLHRQYPYVVLALESASAALASDASCRAASSDGAPIAGMLRIRNRIMNPRVEDLRDRIELSMAEAETTRAEAEVAAYWRSEWLRQAREFEEHAEAAVLLTANCPRASNVVMQALEQMVADFAD
jgi:hypothetical protein